MRIEDILARLEALEDALDRLRRQAMGNVVVVEGRKDVVALESLGVGGEHVLLNQGLPLLQVLDQLAEHARGRQVVVLTDWDRTGGRLCLRVQEALRARVPLDVDLRRRLASACRVRTLEEVPADLAALRRQAGRA